MNIDDLEWQYIGEDTWNFGPKIRGLVHKVADIYFDEDKDQGWRWQTYVGDRVGGYCNYFEQAVKEIEDRISRGQ